MMTPSRIIVPKLNFKLHVVESIVGLFIIAVGLLPSMITTVMLPTRAGLLTVIHLAVTSVIAYVLGWKNVKAAFLLLMIILPWQPFLSMPLASTLGETGTKILVATKDVYIAFLLAALYFKNGRAIVWTKIELIGIVFLGIYGVYGLISPASILGIAVSFREGFMVFATYLVGRLSRFKLQDLRWFGGIIIVTATVVLVFGYIEYFVWSEVTWTMWGAGEYFLAKNGVLPRRFNLPGAVPFNWHTGIDGVLYRRMVSGIGDPTSLSRYLSLPLLILMFTPPFFAKMRRFSLLWFLFVIAFVGAIILTFGRGGWIIIIIGIMIWLVTLNRSLFLLAIALTPVIFLSPFISTAFFVHLPSALAGIRQIVEQPLGRGLGTAGQLALYHAEGALEGTGESYLAALSFQTGILGVVAYTGFVVLLAIYLWQVCQYVRADAQLQYIFPYVRLSLMLIVAIFATSLFSNSAVAPISAGTSLMYCGIAVTAWHTMLQNRTAQMESVKHVGTS